MIKNKYFQKMLRTKTSKSLDELLAIENPTFMDLWNIETKLIGMAPKQPYYHGIMVGYFDEKYVPMLAEFAKKILVYGITHNSCEFVPSGYRERNIPAIFIKDSENTDPDVVLAFRIILPGSWYNNHGYTVNIPIIYHFLSIQSHRIDDMDKRRFGNKCGIETELDVFMQEFSKKITDDIKCWLALNGFDLDN